MGYFIVLVLTIWIYFKTLEWSYYNIYDYLYYSTVPIGLFFPYEHKYIYKYSFMLETTFGAWVSVLSPFIILAMIAVVGNIYAGLVRFAYKEYKEKNIAGAIGFAVLLVFLMGLHAYAAVKVPFAPAHAEFFERVMHTIGILN